MHMELYIGLTRLRISKAKLEKHLEEVYLRHYKKDRLKHVTTENDRLPHVKVTNDLVSFSMYFKNNYGREMKLHFDGKYHFLKEEIDILHISPDDFEELNQEEYQSILSVLKALSSVCEGYILIDTNGETSRLQQGSITGYKKLMDELFDAVDDEKKESVETLFHWLRNGRI